MLRCPSLPFITIDSVFDVAIDDNRNSLHVKWKSSSYFVMICFAAVVGICLSQMHTCLLASTLVKFYIPEGGETVTQGM